MCFALGTIEHLLIWVAVIIAVFAIIRLLLRLATPPEEFAWILNTAVEVIRIVLWLAIVIAVIVVLFALIECVFPFPALR